MKEHKSLANIGLAVLLAAVAASLQSVGAAPAKKTTVIPAPMIPARTFRVTDYGARRDGKTLDTHALQSTVDACEKAGGGIVDVPPGRYLTGPFSLASRLNLHLEKGATILITNDIAHYPMQGGGYENCITASKCQDLAITGHGTIDGQGKPWWDRYRKRKAPGQTEAVSPNLPHRPFMVVLSRCRRVLVQGITLANSPSFHLVPDECRDVTIRNISISAPEDAPNTDGMDPSGWNYEIKGCTFDVGDDCIAVKPGRVQKDGRPSCENFTISDCAFLHGHGMSIGGQTRGGLRNLTVRDCSFNSTQAGIRMKAPRGAGGLAEDLTYDNLLMKNVRVPILITSYYPRIPKDPAADPAQPVRKLTPFWRHIRINRVTAAGSDTAGQIIGLPEAPVSDVVLSDVHISARKGMQIVHARGVRFINSEITAASGPPFILADADVTGIDQPRTDGGSEHFSHAPGAAAVPRSRAGSTDPAPTAANPSTIGNPIAFTPAGAKDAGGNLAPIPRTAENELVVSPSGPYKSVQDAIDAVRPGTAGNPAIIRIRSGTYRARLRVPREKRFIQLVGDDPATTVLSFNLYASQLGPDGKPIGTFSTATVEIDADDFSAKNITFENIAGPRGQALALRVDGDRDLFRNCRFLGWQDTILDSRGRHYYDHCAVSGSVDFIFGDGTAVFNQCDITEIRDSGGVLTAPSTPQNQPFGLVFLHCRIMKAADVRPASTTLMRPWMDYGMSAFIDCAMADDISPKGWSEWDGREKSCRAIEYGSVTLTGQPIDLSQRAPWVHVLTSREAAKYTVSRIFNGWIPAAA